MHRSSVRTRPTLGLCTLEMGKSATKRKQLEQDLRTPGTRSWSPSSVPTSVAFLLTQSQVYAAETVAHEINRLAVQWFVFSILRWRRRAESKRQTASSQGLRQPLWARVLPWCEIWWGSYKIKIVQMLSERFNLMLLQLFAATVKPWITSLSQNSELHPSGRRQQRRVS